MAIKTISLELDAYEKLRREKRGKESFSDVVRRACFEPSESTGAAILRETRALYAAGTRTPRGTLDYWDKVESEPSSGVSKNHWDEIG